MAFRSSSANTNNSSTNPVGNRPSGTADGDVLIAGIMNGNNISSLTAPSGWSNLYPITSNGDNARLSVWVKVASSEPASWTWTSGGISAAWIVHVVALTGRDTASPMDGHNGQVNGSSTSVTAPSISPATATCDLVGFFMSSSTSTFTPASGMTERNDNQAGTTVRSQECATEVLSSSGATGTRVATSTNAGSNIGWIGAVKEAATSGREPSLLMAA